MKKRTWLFVIALVAALALLVGCGGGGGGDSSDGNGNGETGKSETGKAVEIAKTVETVNLSVPVIKGYDDSTDDKSVDMMVSLDAALEPENYDVDPELIIGIREYALSSVYDGNFQEFYDSMKKDRKDLEVGEILGKPALAFFNDDEGLVAIDIYVYYDEVKGDCDHCFITIMHKEDLTFEEAQELLQSNRHLQAILSGMKFK
jgi:hypothetical protein